VVVVALVVAAGGVGGYLLLQRRAQEAQRAAAEDFAKAWTGGTLASLRYAVTPAAEVAKNSAAATAGLTPAAKDHPDSVEVTGVDTQDDAVTASLAVTWTLPGDRAWRYDSTLALVRSGGGWVPRWAPSTVHPRLEAGGKLTSTTRPGARGRILGAGGTVLVQNRPVVVVGIQPSRADDVAATATRIAGIVGVDAGPLATRAAKASPDSFVEAVTLRRDAYDQVRSRLRPIPGAVFQEREQSLAPTPTFARAVLGSVGAANADVIKESRGRVQAGDVTGLSGIQRQYDEQLSGTAGLLVQVVPAGPDAKPTTLFEAEPQDGTDLATTLDERTQKAAEAALARAPKPAGMVAIRASTGEVLAVANGGPNAAGYNRALLGQYPPGSTFKVASGLAMLESGITPRTTITCPATINVGGKTFKNAEDEVLGPAPFSKDFADSCNTAFVGSSTKVKDDDLLAAARSVGYGVEPDALGVPAFAGQVPTGKDAVAHAATMIGQGQVLASPLTVAGASAAVASGRYHPPVLVRPAAAGDASPAGPEPAGKALPDTVQALRTLMRGVVTGGTATALRSVPGGPVAGKTGTAEYGSEVPPRTHAWFTGFQGDLAFAFVVEDGGFGAETAVPLAKNFLTRLAG
jgi:cell division protein FtsI/penicillin-binding protein 2